MQADAQDRHKSQVTRDHFAQLAQTRVETIDHGQNFARRPEKHTSLGGQGKTFLAPLDEAHAVTLFQRLDLLAHRALRDAVELRGLRKTGGFGQIAEYFEKQGLHRLMSSSYTSRFHYKQI